MRRLLMTGAMVAIALSSQAADALRLATMDTGTVNWELDTIKNNKLDEANGFSMEISGMAGDATKVAFESEQADAIVADLVWVLGQNASGRDYLFFPYSKNIGALIAGADKGIEALPDLEGKKIGIAGGSLDKNWLILKAYSQKELGFDLEGSTEQVFGAPPLIMQTALKGETDAALNFWHFQTKMQNAGMVPVIQVSDAATALGLDPNTPLLGYVVRRDYAEANPEVIKGLTMASKAAKDLIKNDDTAWEALRERVNPKDDQQFAALRAAYIAGIPSYEPVNVDGVNALLTVLSENGGEELVPEGAKASADMFIE